MREDAAAPLAGCRVLITRGEQQSSRLADALTEHGAETISIPAIAIVPPESYKPLDAALKSIHEYDCLILTSANAVRVLGERLRVLGIEWASVQQPKVAVVGPSTAEAAEAIGLKVAAMPEEFVAEGLLKELRDQVDGKRVLLVRAKVARDLLPVELERCGAQVEIAEAYQTVLAEASVERIGELFRTRPPDVVTFTSGSTVRNFVALLKAAGIEAVDVRVRMASIGPVTSAAIREVGRELGLTPAIEAEEHTIAGLVDAVIRLVE